MNFQKRHLRLVEVGQLGVWGLGLGVNGLGFRVQGLGLWVYNGLGFRAWGSGY